MLGFKLVFAKTHRMMSDLGGESLRVQKPETLIPIKCEAGL